MYILIYRKADGTIRRITNCKKYLERDWTLQRIQDSIVKFNENYPDNQVELRKVTKNNEDFLSVLIPDDVEFMTDPILHDAYDYARSGKYIYEFVKCEGHDLPVINIMKMISRGEYRVAEIRHDEGELPFAWCYASDLLDKLGVSKGAMNQMLKSAESVAWGWYKKQGQEKEPQSEPLQTNEYQINHAGTPYESIEISKTALERLRDHYFEKIEEYKSNGFMSGSYTGQTLAFIELLKCFENNE